MSTQGERLKDIRSKLKLSQEELGQVFNVTKSYISLIERDKCNFSIAQLKKLLLDFNVNLNYLIADIGSPFIQNNPDVKSEILADVQNLLKSKGII